MDHGLLLQKPYPLMIFPSPSQCGSWLLAFAALFLCSCSSIEPLVAKSTVPKGWWHGDGVSGKARIVIDLSQQQIRYFKGGQLVGASPISSGRESHSTPPGTYHIVEKDADHRSSLYGAYCDSDRQIVVPDVDVNKDERPPGTQFIGASMPFFMRINGGVGMHEGYLPGYPASHGCIRLPAEMAEIFYHATPQGTAVEIVGNASEAITHTSPPVLTPPAPAPAKHLVAAHSTGNASSPVLIPTRKSVNGWFLAREAQKKKAQPVFGATQYLQE
ncbi:MAG: hypothetical protein JWO89_2457 [Verrucomicrobiaceae bacterium]|nr:hypothetical protein [Verrucomicrobiaceae bacterium]